MKNRIITIAMALVALFGVSFTVTAAQSNAVNLAGSETAEINCAGKRLVIERTSKTQVMATCRPSNNTPTDPPTDLAVVDLILVNADTDQDIGPLTDGSTLNFNELGTQNLNIRAETQPSTVGSVKFSLDGNTNPQTENIAPYAIGGDNNGDYNVWTPSVGQHTLTATPYTERNGGGTQGTALTVAFTVINDGSNPPSNDPPSASVPLCEDHDPNAWHPLYDAQKNCHYNHEHKDDPHLVDDIFGPVGALYGGQELSYPWQTFKGAGEGFPASPGEGSGLMENQLKHEGYGWLVRRDMGCSSKFADKCITDFRLQYHAIMASHGAVTRFHSFWLEARGCLEDNPDVCGIIRTGGWLDYGRLEIDGQYVPLPGDPAEQGVGRRIHYYNTGNTNFGTWYSASKTAHIAIQTSRMWGLVSPDDPFQPNFFCPDNACDNNGSNMQAHVISPIIPDTLDTDGDGIVNFDGYTDRYGEIVDNCTEVGLDCVPLQIIHMPVGYYQYRDDNHGVGDGYLYDTSPPGEHWITYPN